MFVLLFGAVAVMGKPNVQDQGIAFTDKPLPKFPLNSGFIEIKPAIFYRYGFR